MNADDVRMSEYLDGRLTPGAAAAFERRLAGSPALARRVRLARLAREALRSTAAAMPADLKASLKAEARRRAAAAAGPRWVDRLREALAVSPWACGAGAAFAAAALLVGVRLATAPREDAAGVARRDAPPAAGAAERARLSADLWSDDDGSDRDD
ncbi:MAG: hypothetical protein HY079_05760 [Elusimicrobia bacterium]|nr:hypothetical protein [Elusimicrobiota bacterium]